MRPSAGAVITGRAPDGLAQASAADAPAALRPARPRREPEAGTRAGRHGSIRLAAARAPSFKGQRGGYGRGMTDSGDVPSGAILAAITMAAAPSSGGEPSGAFAEEAAALVQTWGIPGMAQAFSFLIDVAMTLVQPGSGGPDRVHQVLPAVLTRLQETGLPKPLLATMAGALAAAALEADSWQWRQGLGPLTGAEAGAEALAWCYTAYLLADFIDTIVLGSPGEFGRRVTAIVLAGEEREAPGQ